MPYISAQFLLAPRSGRGISSIWNAHRSTAMLTKGSSQTSKLQWKTWAQRVILLAGRSRSLTSLIWCSTDWKPWATKLLQQTPLNISWYGLCTSKLKAQWREKGLSNRIVFVLYILRSKSNIIPDYPSLLADCREVFSYWFGSIQMCIWIIKV